MIPIQTEMMMIAPTMTSCIYVEVANKFRPLIPKDIIMTPKTVRRIPPSPPKREVPPITTEPMLSSRRVPPPRMGCPEIHLEVRMMPPIADKSPLSV
jgi:hypothetical protein